MSSDRSQLQWFGRIAVLILFLTISTLAGPILVWDPNPEPDIIGYNVYVTDLTTGSTAKWNAGAQRQMPLNVEPGHAYSFAVTAYNAAGLESAPSAPLHYEAPIPPPVLTVAWDRSVYGTIANYTLFYGELNQSAASLNAGLNTSISVSNLVRGSTYYFYVIGRDAAGNEMDRWLQVTATIPAEGDLGSLHIPRANLPPTVALTSPAPLSTYTLPALVPLAATATDVDGTIAAVDFYVGATRVATRTTPPYTASWSGQAPGTYLLSALARDSQGASTRSTTVQITLKEAVPTAPASLVAETSADSIRLRWVDTSSNETGFRVYRWNGTAFVQIAVLAANAIEHIDSGLLPGTTYSYRLCAYNTAGESSAAQVSATTMELILPPPPGSIAARPVAGGIEVSWSICEGATQYQLERALVLSGPFGAVTTTASSVALDSNVVPGTTYFYRVLAQASGFTSAPSPIATATAPDTAPAAPSNLKASAAGKTELKLTWRDNSSNETSFVVERSLDGLSFSTLANLPANTTAFVDGSLAPRRRYFYRVKAQNSGGGNYSPVLATKTR